MTFEEFAADRLPGVLRFAAVLTGDRALAEDLAQEVLIRAHARWRKIGRLDRPEYYVRKMILNEFLHWRRREWRLIPSGTGSDVDRRSAPDHAAGYAERDALVAQLGKLPARQRAVLALRYYEGLSDTEIANLIGCGGGTVLIGLVTGRKAIRPARIVTEKAGAPSATSRRLGGYCLS